MALTGEVGELVEHFQWLSGEESDSLSPEVQEEVLRELADVQIYLMLLADRLDADLLDAVSAKIDENERKYPVEQSRGRSSKYTEL